MADLSKLRLNTNPPPVLIERMMFVDHSGRETGVHPAFSGSDHGTGGQHGIGVALYRLKLHLPRESADALTS